jgi:hypothetical protein
LVIESHLSSWKHSLQGRLSALPKLIVADDVPSEMRFETPEIVEVLARPEENEGRADVSLVPTCDGIVHTVEQAPASVAIADV